MSTTQTIKIIFTVDGSVADTAHIMDGLIAHIQAIGGTRDLKATQKRVVEQWWTNPIPQGQVGEGDMPLAHPALQRQQADQSFSDDWPVMEPSEAAREAFPSAIADDEEEEQVPQPSTFGTQAARDAQTDLNESVYESGDYMFIGEGERITGTGESDNLEPTKHYATRYKRCLLLHIPK
jgi:hypothetical protein